MNILDINKSLLLAVKGNKLIFGAITIKNNNINYRYRYRCGGILTNATENLNLNDFLLDCKKWAYSKGYLIKEEYNKVTVFNKDNKKEVFSIYENFITEENFIPYDRNLLIKAYYKILELIKKEQ